MPSKPRRILNFLCAVLLASVFGCVVQTQFNLAELQALGVPLPLDVRLRSIGHDLIGFMPLYAFVVSCAFAGAMPAASRLARIWPVGRWLLFALAGGFALLLALLLVNALTPPPTLIAANRSLAGTLWLMAGGALGALLYTWLRGPLAKADV
jgi:hypothetical protein